MGLLRQEYRSGLPFPPPGDLPDPGTEPASPALQADSLPLSHLGGPKIVQVYLHGKWYVVYLKYKFKWAYCIIIYHSHTLVVGDSWEGLEISSLVTPGVVFATSI